MVNTTLLVDRINSSGLKRAYIAQELGITRAGLYNKLKGETEFTLSEAAILCDVLNISNVGEKELIFFSKSRF